jgi:hypothetical protein
LHCRKLTKYVLLNVKKMSIPLRRSIWSKHAMKYSVISLYVFQICHLLITSIRTIEKLTLEFLHVLF